MDFLPPDFALPHPAAWLYRVEGGQKMVFALRHPHRRPHHPPCILSLFSAAAPPPHHFPQPLFARHLAPYLQPLRIVHLSHSYVAALIAAADPHRPPARRVSEYRAHSAATLQPDAALHFGPSTRLIELKPKSALLSHSRLTPPAIARALRKFTTPTFHVKHYLMRGSGSVPPEPYYPADLLSADLDRMTMAVAALLRDKAPGIRVFTPDPGEPMRAAEIATHAPTLRAVDAALAALYAERAACEGVKAVQCADCIDVLGAEALMLALVDRVGQAQAQCMLRDALEGLSVGAPAFAHFDAKQMCLLQAMVRGHATNDGAVVGAESRMLGEGAAFDALNLCARRFEYSGQTRGANGAVTHRTASEDAARTCAAARPLAPCLALAPADELDVWKARIAYDSPSHGAKLHDMDTYEEAVRAVTEMPVDVMVRLLADFLQAAAAKDCSFLVAVAATGVDADADVVVDGQGWRYKVWVVDVGEKDVGKVLGKWPKVERERASVLAGGGQGG